MNLLEWLGIGAGTAGVVYLATRPSPAPLPPALIVQARPFAAGWYADATTAAAVGAILRQQLMAIYPACVDLATCQAAQRSFAAAQSIPDPTVAANATEAAQQQFAYAVDDKYRLMHGLPAASTTSATSGLFSPARHRGKV